MAASRIHVTYSVTSPNGPNRTSYEVILITYNESTVPHFSSDSLPGGAVAFFHLCSGVCTFLQKPFCCQILGGRVLRNQCLLYQCPETAQAITWYDLPRFSVANIEQTDPWYLLCCVLHGPEIGIYAGLNRTLG